MTQLMPRLPVPLHSPRTRSRKTFRRPAARRTVRENRRLRLMDRIAHQPQSARNEALAGIARQTARIPATSPDSDPPTG